MNLKQIIRAVIPQRVKDFIVYSPEVEFGTLAFSENGEDMIVDALLRTKKRGFYVDVGAHHPYRKSNTYLFYKKGWRGINIEPNPNIHSMFMEYRKRDINLSVGIADQPGQLEYFIHEHPAMNTFDPNVVSSKENFTEDKIMLDVRPLRDILNEHMPKNTEIDFMNIDTEGFDLKVLKSNDWSKYSPRIVLVEDHHIDLAHENKTSIYSYMQEMGYTLVAGALKSYFYVRNDQN